MIRTFIATVLFVPVLLSACAIEPTPDQTTGSYTVEIANHIRCEARAAIVAQTFDLLDAYHRDDLRRELGTGSPEEFRAAEATLKALESSTDPDERGLAKRIDYYRAVAIAYEFNLDVTENNVNRLGLGLLGPFTAGTGLLGLQAGIDRSRQNIRIFTMTDTFGGLVRDAEVCRKPPQRIDFIYPMGGAVSIAEAVNNFVDLNELSRKKAEDVEPVVVRGSRGSAPDMSLLSVDKNGKAEVYSTTFRFQTIVDGGWNPGFTYTPTTFGPSQGTLTNTAKRTDIHQVIVGFSLPAPKQESSGLSATLYGRKPAAPGGSVSAGEAARNAISDAKVDYFLQNFSSGLLAR